MGDHLIDYLAQRTRERFTVLVDNTHRHVHMIASRCVGDARLAEDVTQEVFLRLASIEWKPENVRSGMGLLSRFTVSVARTRLRSFQRQRRREVTLDEAPAVEASAGLCIDDAIDLQEAVKGLPHELRRCVFLKFYLDLKNGEIAERLKIRPRTVQARLQRACELLRRRLTPKSMVMMLIAFLPEAPPMQDVSPQLAARLGETAARCPKGASAPGDALNGRTTRLSLLRWAYFAAAALLLVGGLVAILPVLTIPRGGTSTTDVPAPFFASVPGPANHGKETESPNASTVAVVPASTEFAPGETEESAAVCKVLVVDEDGEPVRWGVVQVLRVKETVPEGAVAPGSSAEAAGVKQVIFRGDLSDENPAAFRIAPEHLGVPLLARVSADGYPPFEKEDLEIRDGRDSIRIAMRSRGAATIRLLDAVTGEPAPSLRVKAVPGAGEDGHRRPGLAIVAREVEAGVHSIRGIDEGNYDLAVYSPRTVAILKEDIELRDDILLWVHAADENPAGTSAVAAAKRTGAIAVAVFDTEGMPWPGVEVNARVEGKILSRNTDDAGRCRFEDLADGQQTFFLPLKEEPPSVGTFIGERSIAVRPGRERHVVLGSPRDCETLEVDVEDPRGAPLPGVVVRIEGTRFFIARTGPDGRAVFRPIPPGGYSLALPVEEKKSAWVREEEVLVRSGEANHLRIQIGTATVRGRIRSLQPGGFHVLARMKDRVAAHAVGTDGVFEFPAALPGKLLLSATGDERGFLYKRRIVVDVPERGDLKDVEIRLEGLGALRVDVSLADGRPVPGVRVAAVGAAGTTQLPRRSSGMRAAEFGGLVEPEAIRVVVSIKDRPEIERWVDVQPGEDERLEVIVLE